MFTFYARVEDFGIVLVRADSIESAAVKLEAELLREEDMPDPSYELDIWAQGDDVVVVAQAD